MAVVISGNGGVMAAKSRASRDPAKERYWREKVKQWRESGMSQAQFCREQSLNTSTFATWRKIIRHRDLGAPAAGSRKFKPTFAKVEFAEPDLAAATVSMEQPNTNSSIVTAELINAETGMKLRIFSAADQATLAAVLSVWAGR